MTQGEVPESSSREGVSDGAPTPPSAPLAGAGGLPARMPVEPMALLVMAAYLAVAWTFHNLYPFTVASMYAQNAHSASRLVVVEAGGRVSDIAAWQGFQCPASWRAADEACLRASPAARVPYLDEEAAEWIRSHPANGATTLERVRLTRRIYRLSEVDGRWSERDCLLAECEAVR